MRSERGLSLRQAVVQDAPVLARAERKIAHMPGLLASLPHELTEAKLAAKIAALTDAPRGRFLVAEHAGSIVAHGVLDPLQLEVTRHVVALTLVVHPGWQGQGIGHALLSALLEWARAAPEVEKVELRVRSGNERAMRLYRSLGFVEEGRMVKRIKLAAGTYLDDVSMGLWVGPTAHTPE